MGPGPFKAWGASVPGPRTTWWGNLEPEFSQPLATRQVSLTRDERPRLFTMERFAAASPGRGLWCLVLVARIVVILLTCLPSCELQKARGSVLILSVSYFLSRTFRRKINHLCTFFGSLQTGHAEPTPTLTSSTESNPCQGLEGICSFCGLSPWENFGVCGPSLDH